MRSKQDFIIERFGPWAVTQDGVQHMDKKHPYIVGVEQLGWSGWCRHIAKKWWAKDVKSFEKALRFARKHFGFKTPKYGDWTSIFWITPREEI